MSRVPSAAWTGADVWLHDETMRMNAHPTSPSLALDRSADWKRRERLYRLVTGITAHIPARKAIPSCRPTGPCSRPLRARDHWHFDTFCSALAAADGQSVGPRINLYL